MYIQIIMLCMLCMGVSICPSIRLVYYGLNTFANTSYMRTESNTLTSRVDSNAGVSNLNVLQVSYRQYANPIISSSSKLFIDNRMVIADFYHVDMYQQPLVYPNPMRLRDTGTVGYWLNQNQSVRMIIYNMFGHKMMESNRMAGMNGATMGYNKLDIGPETFDYVDVSAGIYFLVIFDQMNRLLGKTKFAIIP